MRHRWAMLGMVLTLATFGADATRAQGLSDLIHIPGVQLPFQPGALPQTSAAAIVNSAVNAYNPATDGMAFVLGLSPSGQRGDPGDGMDPVSRLSLQRGKPNPILGGAAASQGVLTREARSVVDDYRIQSSPLTSVVGNVAALGMGEAPLLALSPPDQLRYEQLSARLTELSFDELAELQELYRRGFGNPDPGTPGVPSRVPSGLPTGALVLDASAACNRIVDNALMCAYLDPQNPSWQSYCSCS